MQQLQRIKRGIITAPAAIVDNASHTTTAIDTAGFGQLAVHVIIGATDIAWTALKLQSSDASNMANPVDITGCVYGTSTLPETGATSALPTADDDNKIFSFYVNLDGKHGRYIDLVSTIGDGSAGGFMCAFYELCNSESGLSTSASRGEAAALIA